MVMQEATTTSPHDADVDGTDRPSGLRGRFAVFRARLPSLADRWHRLVRKPARILALVLIAFGGCYLGLYFGGAGSLPVGPVETTWRLVPSLTGDTSVMVPPLGTLGLDSHDGPLRLDVTIDRIDQDDAAAIVKDPNVLGGLQTQVVADLRDGVTYTLVRGLIAGSVGAGLITLLFVRRVRPTVVITGATAVTLVAAYGIAGLTWNPRAITEPRFDGLLSSAPSLIGNASDIAENFDAYSGELARMVTNVTKLYDATSALPTYAPNDDVIRVLHVSDIHLGEHAWGVISSVVEQYDIDVIVDSGDITEGGTAAENAFLQSIPSLGVPYVWVRGNHDSMITEQAIRKLPNVIVLDGKVRTVEGIRFLGAGDPRFTPDRRSRDIPTEVEAVAQQARALVEVAKRESLPIDVFVYHDPAGAAFFDGNASLILSGHRHTRMNLLMPKGTRLMQEGSTGGDGLRALQQVDPDAGPAPIEMSVLYIGKNTKQLEAWDEITLGGLGLTSAEIERRQVDPNEESEGHPTPVPTPTGPPPTAPVPSPTISRMPTLPPSAVPSPSSPSPGSPSPTSPPPATPRTQAPGSGETG
ncbi:MAG TPA: metallophosphoesterase [Actinopolymorphaceae bacterium]